MAPIARSPAERWLPLLAAALAWLVAVPVGAHTLRPAIATASFAGDGGFVLEIETNLEARLAGIGPSHTDTRNAPTADRYDRLRALPPAMLRAELEPFLPGFVARLRPEVDGEPVAVALRDVVIPPVGDLDLARKSVVRLAGTLPVGATTFRWRWPVEYGDCALRLRYGDGPVVVSYWLEAGEASPPFALDATVVPRPWHAVALDYLELGFTHILPRGLDHILFVLGLFLLSLRLGPILWQVTAFTLAHTLTLALSVYGVIALPAAVVEPLIALSIAYVGIENIVSRRLHPWRVAVVFAFGLLHGMGFAGVLTGIGLPERDYVTALVAFNVGVEFGQLAVILLALLAVGGFRRRAWYRARIVVPASAAIACVGLFWTVERTLL
ncbi:MAG: HupE/UreJ family protein [Gammaproteobacteria bacterium]|nr:HupE/UreJ family protein [Gammaproteobacteria bacterium]